MPPPIYHIIVTSTHSADASSLYLLVLRCTCAFPLPQNYSCRSTHSVIALRILPPPMHEDANQAKQRSGYGQLAHVAHGFAYARHLHAKRMRVRPGRVKPNWHRACAVAGAFFGVLPSLQWTRGCHRIESQRSKRCCSCKQVVCAPELGNATHGFLCAS